MTYWYRTGIRRPARVGAFFVPCARRRLRLAPLLGVFAALACASSQPALVPASPAAAVASPAPPRLAIENSVQYYDIDGSSAGALRGQINRLGPREGGNPRDALTVWNLEWTYGQVRTGSDCVLRDVQLTLTLTTTLPRWKPPSDAPPRLLQSWRTYLGHVTLHEAAHRAVAEQNARDLMAALSALRTPTCDQVWEQASHAAEEIVAAGRAKNRAYDVATKHGQTQGVTLVP